MKTTKRLGPDDWIKAGFRALAKGGVSSVRVELLGRELGASKGSFYWHFLDLQALKTAMLLAWVQLATVEISHSVNQLKLSPQDAIHALVSAISIIPDDDVGGVGIEPAIRDWARFDIMVSKTVARIDADRIDYVTNLFASAGLDATKSKENAEIFYATFIGLEHLRLTCGINIAQAMTKTVHFLLPKMT
jgi:AcrR family transcriptional regulator